MIKKLSNNRWKIQCYGVDRYGKKIRRRRIVNGSKNSANKLLFELQTELENLKNGFMFSSFTFEEFLDKEFLPFIDENHAGEYVQISTTMRKWCKPIMALKLDTVNPNDIKAILAEAGKHLSLSSVRKIRSYMNRFFNMAVDGGLKSNPCENVKVNMKNVKEYQPAVLTAEEIKILLAKARIYKKEWFPIWSVALFTMLRNGELYALQRSDVDLENQIIDVSKSWNSKTGIVKSTKSGKWRKVPIADNLMPLMRELMIGEKTDYLLPHPSAWKKGFQAKILREFCQGIGINKNIKFHDLRATGITALFIGGASIAEVQAIVGHVDLATTQRYVRLAGVNVAGVTNKLQITLPEEHINNVVNMFGT